MKEVHKYVDALARLGHLESLRCAHSGVELLEQRFMSLLKRYQQRDYRNIQRIDVGPGAVHFMVITLQRV